MNQNGTEEELVQAAVQVMHDQEWAVFPDQIYHLNSGSKKMMWNNKDVPHTRFNFECPTHPLSEPSDPTVTILLGNS